MADKKSHLQKKVDKLPLGPGVYFMRNPAREILYIGKAKSLKKRVRSYFRVPAIIPKIAILMGQVVDIDYVETPTEVDALLLEAHLIRKYQPKYNQELKDDKSFPLLKITHEKFPRLCITRQKTDSKALYYGPYTDAKLLRQAVNLINSLFPIRKCQILPKTACLYYHIGQCLAPCIKSSVKESYDSLIDEVKRFLGGGKKSFAQYLNDRMEQASQQLRYEDAQFYKEQIDALAKLKRKRFMPKNPVQGISLSATLGLKEIFKMDRLPERIVCFDVSNVQGDQAVASKVSFYRELPDKFGYRRYKIKGVQGINDYAMMAEALRRMLRGIKEDRENFVPDLIVIDGGKGHLNAALRVLKQEGMDATELISIAKRFEWVFSTKFSAPKVIASDAPALHLLQKVRDEAHRFAIAYHHALKEKTLRRSILDDIPGIGGERKKVLLENFDSIEELKRVGVAQLQGLPGMTLKTAQAVWDYFHTNRTPSNL
ncbi:MAG TPA: excinuclease ABC subunit UvrC [Candidatus Omnitrophota bacterium]|nr:excinuclease ABC subunit UvrC [Candidatus Omnitrophota bacterium]